MCEGNTNPLIEETSLAACSHEIHYILRNGGECMVCSEWWWQDGGGGVVEWSEIQIKMLLWGKLQRGDP